MKKDIRANGEAIKKLRAKAGLNQSEIFKDKYKKYDVRFGYRNYQRAEAGEKLNKRVLEEIATFYDKFLREAKGYKENIYVTDIILEDEKDKTKKETKNFSHNIYLHKIENYEQLSDIIKQSKFQKTFYPSNPDEEQAELIKNMVRGFKQTYDGYNDNSKNKNTDGYEDIEKELFSLDMTSSFSTALKELGKKQLYLYANNFVHSFIGTDFEPDAMVLMSRVFSRNYAIFCFRNFKTSSLTFKYETDYPKDKLEKLVEDRPWSMDPADDPDHLGKVDESFKKHFKKYLENNSQNFDKSKVSLIKTDIEDLVDEDDLIEYANKHVEDEVEQGNLMYAPDISDYIDPKDD